MELLPTPARPAPDGRVTAVAVARGLPESQAGRDAVAAVIEDGDRGTRAVGVTLLAAAAGLESRPTVDDCRADALAGTLSGVLDLADDGAALDSAVDALSSDDAAGDALREAVPALEDGLPAVLSGDVAADPDRLETLTRALGGDHRADGAAQVVCLHAALGSAETVSTLQTLLDVEVRSAMETTLAALRDDLETVLYDLDEPGAGRPVPDEGVEDVSPVRSGPAATGATLDPGTALVRAVRGELARLDGDYAAAHEHYATAVESLEAAGDTTAAAVCRANLASVYRALGEHDAALAQYDGANEQFRGPTVSLRRAAALCTVSIGEAALDDGRVARAEGYLGRSREDFEATDDPWGVARARQGLAKTAGRRGSPDEAVEHYREALSLYDRLGDDRGTATVAHELGVVARQADVDERPDERFTEALTAAQRVGAHATAGGVAVSFGELAVERGDDDLAVQHFEAGLASFRAAGDRDGEATCLHNLGSLAEDRGDEAAARERFEAAGDAFRAAGNDYGAAHATDRLGELERSAHPDRARERFETAAETFVQLGAVDDALPTLSSLIVVAMETGAHDLAREKCDLALELVDRTDDDDHRAHFEELRRRVEAADET